MGWIPGIGGGVCRAWLLCIPRGPQCGDGLRGPHLDSTSPLDLLPIHTPSLRASGRSSGWSGPLPGALRGCGSPAGYCTPRKDCAVHTKRQAYLIYSPPPKLPGSSMKTLDVKSHTGCPLNTEMSWKQSSDQKRSCQPKDGLISFSATGQPGKRGCRKEGSLDGSGRELGKGALMSTSARRRLILCPAPGRAPRLRFQGVGPGPTLAAPMRGGWEKDKANPAPNEAYRAAPRSAEGTEWHGVQCRGGHRCSGGQGRAQPASSPPFGSVALPWRAGGQAQLRPCRPLAAGPSPGWGAGGASVFGADWAWGLRTPAWAHSQAWPPPQILPTCLPGPGFLMWDPQWACP